MDKKNKFINIWIAGTKKIRFINILIAKTYLTLLIILGVFSLALLNPNPTIPAIMLITAVVVSLVYIELNKE